MLLESYLKKLEGMKTEKLNFFPTAVSLIPLMIRKYLFEGIPIKGNIIKEKTVENSGALWLMDPIFCILERIK